MNAKGETSSISKYSIDELKRYHEEASGFFGAQLSILKGVVHEIKDDKLAKAGILLLHAEHTGTSILLLLKQHNDPVSQCAMLARSFLETITNFCYIGICDEKEYRKFLLHPIYKQYHNTGMISIDENFEEDRGIAKRNERQSKLKEVDIVKEALDLFSEVKQDMPWSNKKLYEKIAELEKWGKMFDVFFTIAKSQYYSDASEAIHGSLYGSTYHIGGFEPGFDPTNTEELNKKQLKENACMLLHLGMLINEVLTLISYTSEIEEFRRHSHSNLRGGLGLLMHIWERPQGS